MTIYFYTTNTPTKQQIYKIQEIFKYFDTSVKITYEALYDDETRINILPVQPIFLVDILKRIQTLLEEIFDSCSLYVK